MNSPLIVIWLEVANKRKQIVETVESSYKVNNLRCKISKAFEATNATHTRFFL